MRLVRRLISTSHGRRKRSTGPDTPVCNPAASDAHQRGTARANGSLQAVYLAHKLQHKTSRGSRHTWSGASACSILPWLITLHDQLLRSPLPGRGSRTRWEFQFFMQLTQPATQLFTHLRSSAPNGSSSSKICGSTASAPPAPHAVSGRRKAAPDNDPPMSKLHHLQQFCHFRFDRRRIGRSRRGNTVRPKAILSNTVNDGTARNAGTRNRLYGPARATAHVGTVEANMPAGLMLQPGIMRSSVVFPEPDGPSNATIYQKEYPVRYRSAPGCDQTTSNIGNLNAHDAPPAARVFPGSQAPLQHTL